MIKHSAFSKFVASINFFAIFEGVKEAEGLILIVNLHQLLFRFRQTLRAKR